MEKERNIATTEGNRSALFLVPVFFMRGLAETTETGQGTARACAVSGSLHCRQRRNNNLVEHFFRLRMGWGGKNGTSGRRYGARGPPDCLVITRRLKRGGRPFRVNTGKRRSLAGFLKCFSSGKGLEIDTAMRLQPRQAGTTPNHFAILRHDYFLSIMPRLSREANVVRL